MGATFPVPFPTAAIDRATSPSFPALLSFSPTVGSPRLPRPRPCRVLLARSLGVGARGLATSRAMRDRDLLGFAPAGAAMSSAAALLLLPILAAAGEGAVCPPPRAAAVILRHASTSCRTVDALGLRGHRAGVVEGDDGALQKAVALVLQNKEDFVAILFYASWCPFSKIFRTDFQKLPSFFPTIAHFSFEESNIKPRVLSRYGVRAFPTIFLLNSTVRVRYHGSRAMNSLAMFYKDVTGLNPVSLDATSLERMEDTVTIIGHDKNTEKEDSLLSWARSPDRLLHQDTCLALASSFVLLRLLHFLLPKLNACMKQAWRTRLHELNRLFPSLS